MDFYVVDAKTGKNRGPVVMDPWDDISIEEVCTDITNEEYDQVAEDAYNEKIHALIEASAEISELHADCKKMLDRMMLTTAALSIALREYRGPYKKELKQRHQEAEDLCAYMYNLYGGK